MYHLILWFLGRAIEFFYRLRRLGHEVPGNGPIVIVANHPNGLIDPVLLAHVCGREVRFLAKEPLFRMVVIGRLLKVMKALPVYRRMDGHEAGSNDKTFRAVDLALAQGEAICLFPEGISHDKPELQPLKTGAARMALGSVGETGSALRIVPVGLVYNRKGILRSDAVVYTGQAISIPPEIVETYERDPRQAVILLTDVIDEAIRSVTVNLDAWEDLPLLELAGQIWSDDQDPVLRLQAMADAQRSFLVREPQGVARLRRKLLAFQTQLKLLGLRPDDLDAQIRVGPAIVFAIRNLIAITVGLPAAGLGTLAYFVPYHSVKVLVSALKPDPDVVGTVKLLGGIVFHMVWQVFLVWLGSWIGIRLLDSFLTGVLAAMCLPGFGVYALQFAGRRAEALHQASVALRLPFIPAIKARLRKERDAIRTEIEGLAALYEDT